MVDEVENADEPKAADSGDQTESSTLAVMTAKMDAIRNKSEGDVDPPIEDVNSPESESVDETKTDDEGQTGESGADSSGKDGDDVPMLPSGHRRAALARGYTNEEVDNYLQSDPDAATRRFAELFGSWQDENSLWSERGRELRNVQVPVSEQQADTDKEPDQGTLEVLSRLDTAALIEKHGGNEELITDIVTPLNATVDRINAVIGTLQKSQTFLKKTEQNALATIIDDFFAGPEMEPFKELYGSGDKELVPDQKAKRMKLFQNADDLVAGARAHGRDITVQAALGRAHIELSEGTRDEVIRQKIRDDMEKRTKTLPSSHAKADSVDAGQPVTEDELVNRVRTMQQEIRSKTST